MPAEQLGHQDAFLRPRPNDRYRVTQGTLAGTRGNGENAPKDLYGAFRVKRFFHAQLRL